VEVTTSADLYNSISLPTLSFHGAALLLFVLLPVSAVAGYLSGSRRRAVLLSQGRETDALVGEATLSAIMGLLGLLLAFTFGNALSVASDRKNSIIEEAAALGTVFLRADYLAEPARTELQVAILDYSKTRILPRERQIGSLDQAQDFLDRTLQAQARLWPLTLEATQDPLPPALKTFVAGAMNDAIDAHLARVRTLSNPISEVTQGMLLAAALVSLFLLGNRAGMTGRSLTWRTFLFSGFLFMVMITILDTQRTLEGFIQMDDTALRTTIFDMETALFARRAAE